EPESKFDVVETSGNMIMGTVAYMSPEQAGGGAVDKRTDVWAFGCVLYEALTGQRAFAGESAADIIASVMKAEPDYSLLPAGMPASVLPLLRRCLQRHPRNRLHDMADVRIAAEDALKELQSVLPAHLPLKNRQRRWRIPGYAALLFTGVVLGWTMTGTPPEA